MSSSSTLVLPQSHIGLRHTVTQERQKSWKESSDLEKVMMDTWGPCDNDMRHKAMMHQNNVTCQPCNRCLHKHKKNNMSQHKCNLCPRYQPSVIKDNKCLSLCFINLIYFISLNFWFKKIILDLTISLVPWPPSNL